MLPLIFSSMGRIETISVAMEPGVRKKQEESPAREAALRKEWLDCDSGKHCAGASTALWTAGEERFYNLFL
jgi:hypothetical protein